MNILYIFHFNLYPHIVRLGLFCICNVIPMYRPDLLCNSFTLLLQHHYTVTVVQHIVSNCNRMIMEISTKVIWVGIRILPIPHLSKRFDFFAFCTIFGLKTSKPCVIKTSKHAIPGLTLVSEMKLGNAGINSDPLLFFFLCGVFFGGGGAISFSSKMMWWQWYMMGYQRSTLVRSAQCSL